MQGFFSVLLSKKISAKITNEYKLIRSLLKSQLLSTPLIFIGQYLFQSPSEWLIINLSLRALNSPLMHNHPSHLCPVCLLNRTALSKIASDHFLSTVFNSVSSLLIKLLIPVMLKHKMSCPTSADVK